MTQSSYTKFLYTYSGGLIKTQKQADRVMVGIICLCVILSSFLVIGAVTPPQTEIIYSLVGDDPLIDQGIYE